MKALVVDFDGVVSDSAPEAFVVALQTYTELRPSSLWGAELAKWGALNQLSRAAVCAQRYYPGFLAHMPHGSRSADYAVSLSLLERGEVAADRAAFGRARAALPREFREEYDEHFYSVRRAFADAQRETWLGWMGPYPDVIALLRRRADEVDLAVATAKDGPTVEILLAQYGVADLFGDGTVLDKDVGRTKRIHLERLQQRLGHAFEEITFVDDKLSQLEAVSPLGVRCVLAAWGYNGEAERVGALSRGYSVCTLADAEACLFAA